jgi:hypothetical protein
MKKLLLLPILFLSLSGCVTQTVLVEQSSSTAAEPERLSDSAQRTLAMCEDMRRRGLNVICALQHNSTGTDSEADRSHYQPRDRNAVERQPARSVATIVRDGVQGVAQYYRCRERGYDDYCNDRAVEAGVDALLNNLDPQDLVVTFITNEGNLTVIDEGFRRSARNSIILARDVDVRQEQEVLLRLETPGGVIVDVCEFRLPEINSRRARGAPPRDYVRVESSGRGELYCD